MRKKFESEERRVEVLRTLNKKKAMAKKPVPICKSCKGQLK